METGWLEYRIGLSGSSELVWPEPVNTIQVCRQPGPDGPPWQEQADEAGEILDWSMHTTQAV
jgi:hypothetical protein